jgi:hypothetical protein
MEEFILLEKLQAGMSVEAKYLDYYSSSKNNRQLASSSPAARQQLASLLRLQTIFPQ